MNSLTIPLVTAYSAYAFFHFYMTWHVKNFRGASRGFEAFLSLFTFVATVFQYGFLLWFAINRTWAGAGLLMLCGFAAFLVGMPLEVASRKYVHRDAPYFLSLVGLIALPTLGTLILRAV